MASGRGPAIERIAALMRDMDFCMLTTRAGDGSLRARPMSNNGEVEFDGAVWFFSGADTHKVREIARDPHVQLSYADPQRFRFVSMSGEATIVRDVERKRALWRPELARWFEDGPESDDVVLLRVAPSTVTHWGGEDEGEITLD